MRRLALTLTTLVIRPTVPAALEVRQPVPARRLTAARRNEHSAGVAAARNGVRSGQIDRELLGQRQAGEVNRTNAVVLARNCRKAHAEVLLFGKGYEMAQQSGAAEKELNVL